MQRTPSTQTRYYLVTWSVIHGFRGIWGDHLGWETVDSAKRKKKKKEFLLPKTEKYLADFETILGESISNI